MPEKDYKAFMEYYYRDKGGYKVVDEIFSADLPYDTKIGNAAGHFDKSRGTIAKWYSSWKAYRERVGR